MGKGCREYIEATEAEVAMHPDVEVTFFTAAGPHGAAQITYKGIRRRVTIASSPSDYRGLRNHIHEVRRICAAMGAKRDLPENAKRPPGERGRDRRAVKPAATPPSTPPRAPPFAPLQKLQAALTDEQLGPWARFRVPPEMLDVGARALIKLWHPQFILRAGELIQQASRGHDDAGSHEPAGAPEGADAVTTDRRVG